ncbi:MULTISPECIES: response regulator [unclassified Janthinobacterium]|uniref:response regulator n=1 Tax=unclassified Janthinobacterium TaxID=2610881 RepID=UPI0003689546|nr:MULTISPECIES: response regulator [unclassified Janthinobacterium]MEC5160067.1 PAS domain S-box-containing protein [Janthinobacterium sp. CG_S6]
MKPLGIKAKVALATSLTSILMIALVTVAQMQRMREDFTGVLLAQQNALVRSTATELDDKLQILLDVVGASARQQPPELMDSPEKLRAHYATRAVLTLFDDVLVLDARGRLIADVPAVPGRAGTDASDRAFFKTVLRTRRPMIAEPVLGKTSKQPIVQFVAPVLDARGEVVGMLIGVLRLYKDNVLGRLRSAKVGKSGYYFAITRGAVPLYVLHPDASRLLQPRAANANALTTRALKEDGADSAVSSNGQGVAVIYSFKTLKSADWTLGAALPLRDAFEPLDGALYRLAAWSAFASLLAAAALGWLTLRLLSPLVRLRDAIRGLRADASQFVPIGVAKHDEIGELTMAFNELMSARQAADARLQSLIEFAPNAMVVVGADGRVETFNRQAERYFGYRRDEIVGQAVETLMPARYRARHANARKGFLDTRLSAEPRVMGRGQALFGLRRDGSEFPLEVSLSAVQTDQGTKVLAVIAEIAERLRLQVEVQARAAELVDERDRAEAANRAKSDFVANMSHEIRTPLNAVLGMAYLLGNTALTAEQRKYLTMVRVSGQSLLGILNDVLDYSKIEARRMELAPVEFDLDEVMNTLATTMTMNAGDKELELAIGVDADVPRRLRGDALRLQQILVNLAGNAIKFTPLGEVLVGVSLERRDAAGARLRFEVRDTGIGMSAAQQAQLFTAFSQGDESITRRFGGTGLGLTISKHLIRLMGGEIAFDSAEGGGSNFWFSLPFEVLREQEGARRKPALGQLRLLVADDNRTSRELIGKLIHAWGWEVDEVDSGAAALALYRRRQAERAPYDVVLADWHMPEMDGLATAKAIRQAASGQKQPIVVMVNAFARNRLEEISSAAEADVVLMKPITGSSLFDALHQALTTPDGGDEQMILNRNLGQHLRGVHFLLVEDNLLNQAVARGILEHMGATLDVVGDGLQAVERLRAEAQRYHIVLMDMQMPVMDGFSATHLIRTELRLTLPVIAMTAGVLASERERCISAGISDFIAKPVVVEEMLEVIDRNLPGRAAAAPAVAAIAAPAPAPAPDEQVFSMAPLMRVLGRDAKGRGILRKMVAEALGNGMAPLRQAELAVREGRCDDAARTLHSLRGAVGTLGTKRLISASLEAERAIAGQRHAEVAALLALAGAELELVLAHARAWLDGLPE